ncbi:unnamed protein product, partial [Choristocarpus tenellus]
MFCPEGSSEPNGVGECPVGFYCPYGVRLACPIGTYCPHNGHWDPMPCPPGTFNSMVAQEACTSCPRGYICSGFGRIDPAICPSGMVCSREGLTSPNLRCPSGFYCPTGTLTSEIFRNDTTLRPYPCSPGSYCLGGVGSSEVVTGNYFYAQQCPAGFFCEAASTSPRGMGLCPKGFYCPMGTSVPIPSPKGYFSDLEGTVAASACLPGYYAPTIESEECYPCPPGTTCAEDGTYVADICPPGTYRSILDEDGTPCGTCPQGTWSKNWELREAGECLLCPTGLVCSVEALTTPCGQEDLPKPFDPVVNVNGVPKLEYLYDEFNRPAAFSAYKCLRLNDGYAEGTLDPVDQVYFFGELIPPYIDILGRGAHFRSTNNDNLFYQSEAKCYRNQQRYGSKVYQRMRDYYGPQYDIQTGQRHQGYGEENNYIGFWGKGSLYIDLPKSRVYDASFNCTPGFQLMSNKSKDVIYDMDTVVYTHRHHDPRGSQEMFLISDSWYPGTCEADIICDTDESPEAEACPEGYVCEEASNSEESRYFPCREGYVCDFGTTPDPNLESPEGQFTRLCPAGFVCMDGTGLGQAYRQECYEDYFCPAGTADPLTGQMSDDAVNRGLSVAEANPLSEMKELNYLGDDDARLVSAHDLRCLKGISTDHKLRYATRWLTELDAPNSLSVDFLREVRPGSFPYTNDTSLFIGGGYARPSIINNAIASDLTCGRDHKWRLVSMAIEREECDCVNQVYVIAGVYRLWKCSGSTLDDLGIGSIHEDYHGGRDFWFERRHLENKNCSFLDINGAAINLTDGAIPSDDELPSITKYTNGVLELNLTAGLGVQFTWTQNRNFTSYGDLKAEVEVEYKTQYEDRVSGTRDAMDPYIYNLYQAVRYIEEFGERLEELVWLDSDGMPGRLDMCECERLLKCPNGTVSSSGSTNIFDCEADGSILRRLNSIPERYMTNPNYTNRFNNGTEFTELTGRDDFALGTMRLESLEVAVITLDTSSLTNNMTYGQHYQLAVYLDCKPCPTQYQCDREVEPPICTSPSVSLQIEAYESCLETHTLSTCYDINGTMVDCTSASAWDSMEMPDWYRCRQIPFFCDDIDWPVLEWKFLFNENGEAEDGATQETSSFYTPEDHEGEVYQSTQGCCQCESHSLPPFFSDVSTDRGYPDTKHNLLSISITALKEVEVTVALELLHGSYYSDFDDLLEDVGELLVFTPARSKYEPQSPSRNSFLFLLDKGNFDELQARNIFHILLLLLLRPNPNLTHFLKLLPFNLPAQWLRVAGSLPSETEKTFEDKVLIDRAYNINVADPDYYTKYTRYLKQKAYFNGENATIPDYDSILERSVVRPAYADVYEDASWWLSGDPAGENSFLSTPYFPFLSSCAGYGNHMSFAKLVETHPDCTRIPYERTEAINQWTSVGKESFADTCEVQLTSQDRYDENGVLVVDAQTRGIYLDCTFEEDIKNPSSKPRWFQAPAGTTIFHVTKNPIEPEEFEESYNRNGELLTRWGRSSTLENLIGTYLFVPVEVSEENPGADYTKPQHVKLTINYYQRQRGTKRMVDMYFDFTELCTTIPPMDYGGNAVLLENFAAQGIEPCEVDYNGDLKDYGFILEVQYTALTWLDLLNSFEFDSMVYMVFFTAVGILAVTEAAIVWGINRFLTKLRRPPPFHGSILFHLISEAPSEGIILALVPAISTVVFIWLWFGEGSFVSSSDTMNRPSILNFEGIAGSWQDNLVLTSDRVLQYRTGRIGVCLAAAMLYLSITSVELFVPDWSKEEAALREANLAKDMYYYDDEEEKPQPSPVFAPNQWKRAHLLWGGIIIQCFLLCIWEFSYSSTFSTYVYQFIVGFKIAQMVMDLIMEGLLREHLLVSPLLVSIGITEALVTMGADDFKA